ncbi:hypothetical protein ADL15_42495 [Actinoplanes awajinensis subsp. mycoplanecinus]|uniref:IPT/TIG domain-containing protein n=2 Tax=Actinoplanes awajinensis TaxID=135946 RepID=A0A101JDP7_9ACTN|nr:hypothetical protein ADL15_42495 [Actinoplanes awajinensis subsp. mycoplanecinus]
MEKVMTYSKKSRRAAGIAVAAVVVVGGVSAAGSAFAAPARVLPSGTVSVLADSDALTVEFEDKVSAKLAGGTVIPVTVGGGTVGATAAAFGALKITAKVGGTAAKIAWVDETHLKVIAPSYSKAAAVSIQLFVKGVAQTESTTLVAYRPTVATVAPAKVSAAGGALVTINGAGFLAVDPDDPDAVTFGDTAATSFTVLSGTRITAIAPAGVAGAAAVTIKTDGGSSEAGAKTSVTYATPLGVDVSDEPAFKASGGPLVLTVTDGTLGDSAKEFATQKLTVLVDKRAFSATYVDATHLKIVTGASAADTAQVAVARDGIVGAEATVSVVPVVTALSANTSTLAGGVKVTVKVAGTSIGDSTGIMFGENEAVCLKQGAGATTTFACVAPPATAAGPVWVSFTSGSGKASRFTGAAAFSYTDN